MERIIILSTHQKKDPKVSISNFIRELAFVEKEGYEVEDRVFASEEELRRAIDDRNDLALQLGFGDTPQLFEEQGSATRSFPIIHNGIEIGAVTVGYKLPRA